MNIETDASKVHFPLSEEDQMTYYDKTVKIGGSDLTYEVYKIGNKYYDIYGTELDENGNDLTENKEIKTEGKGYGVNEIDTIVSKFEELYKEYNIDKSILDGNGTIYYKNGNMGTDGDWETNGHTSYFMVFYKEGELGFAKMAIDTDGKLYGCLWLDNGKAEAIPFDYGKITDYPEEFAALLFEQTDMLGNYSVSIDEINWNAPVERTDYDWLTGEYEDEFEDEDSWYDYDEEDEKEDDYYED